MSGKITEIKDIPFNGTKEGVISVVTIEEPYGANSETVASIGVTLQADNEAPYWKVHIPKENIDEVIEALTEAKNRL